MKTKFNKPIVIGLVIFIITILAVIGIVTLSNNKSKNKNDFEIVTEIDNIRVSGNEFVVQSIEYALENLALDEENKE